MTSARPSSEPRSSSPTQAGATASRPFTGGQLGEQRGRVVGGLDVGALGLEHLGVRRRCAEVGLEDLGEAVVEGPELEEVEQLAVELVDVELAHREVGVGHVERRVAHQHHDLGVEADLVLVGRQVLAQLRRLLVDRGDRCRRRCRTC